MTKSLFVLSLLFLAPTDLNLKSKLNLFVGLIGEPLSKVHDELDNLGDSTRTKQGYITYRVNLAGNDSVKLVISKSKDRLQSLSIRLGNGDKLFKAVRDSLVQTLGHSTDSARGWDMTLRIPARLQHALGWTDYRSYWLVPRDRDTVAILLTMQDKKVNLAFGEMRWLFQDASEYFWQTRADELIPPPPPGRTQFQFDTMWHRR